MDRTHRELTDEEIARITTTYHAWRGEPAGGEYQDVPGFCTSAKVEQVAQHNFVLTPGRYVGSEAVPEDDELIADKITSLKRELFEAFEESDRQQERVKQALERIDG